MQEGSRRSNNEAPIFFILGFLGLDETKIIKMYSYVLLRLPYYCTVNKGDFKDVYVGKK